MRMHQPTDEQLRQYVDCQALNAFSYQNQGASNDGAPDGFTLDHSRVCLGEGHEALTPACEALRQWKMFPASWTRIFPSDSPQETGRVVAVLARAFGLWWLNACRVVYTIDETGLPRRFGFAYGTLPGHVECGEERFLIEQDAQGRVWYDLRTFSRPRHPLIRLAFPLARRLQKRFIRDSQHALQQAVRETLSSGAARSI